MNDEATSAEHIRASAEILAAAQEVRTNDRVDDEMAAPPDTSRPRPSGPCLE
jgi:hypothetical protein